MKWVLPPMSVALSCREVHIWRVPLGVSGVVLHRLQQTLSPGELSRAEGYYFNRDRHRFIVRWAALRDVIGNYLGLEPNQLRFVFGRYGKPALAPSISKKEVQFNLTHSGELALIAITLESEVGIDVERLREEVAYTDLVERYFSPDEAAALRELPIEKQSIAFFKLWTCKEAYLKGTGRGLTLGLDSFSVLFSSDEPQLWLNTGDKIHPASNWTLRQLEPGSPYCAGLAVNRQEWRLRCWQWPGSGEPKQNCIT